MSNIFSHFRLFSLALICLLSVGCATQVTEKPSQITRSSVPLSEFNKVILVKSELMGKYAGQAPNIKATKKIDEVLENSLRQTFKNLTVISLEEYKASGVSADSEKQVLIIEPKIKQIKFIGGAARFWAGAMAGSSVVVMDVNLIDAANKAVLGSAGYYRKANAYGDAFGVGSNIMLNDVAEDIANYIRTNM